MKDDLNKPLGQKPVKAPRKGIPISMAISLLTLFIVAGMGSYIFFSPPPPQPTIIAARKVDSQQTQTPVDPTNTSTVAGHIPDRTHEHDPDAPPMRELEPSGSMVEPKKIKQRPPIAKARQQLALAHNPDRTLIERTSLGVIPKVSKDGLRPLDVYSKQPLTEGNYGVARVVIIVGGLGISQTSTMNAIKKLPDRVTLGFAPYGNSLSRWMQQARKGGHELVLQVPMEPFNYPRNNPGQETLRTDLTPQENIANLHWAMSRITNYVGIMNYLGGKMMTDVTAMRPIMNDMAERGLLFVDDGTVRNSVSKEVAHETLLPYARADVQLDTNRTPAAIQAKLKELTVMAKRKGLAIGVASAFPESIQTISKYISQMEGEGVELTPLSSIVKVPET